MARLSQFESFRVGPSQSESPSQARLGANRESRAAWTCFAGWGGTSSGWPGGTCKAREGTCESIACELRTQRSRKAQTRPFAKAWRQGWQRRREGAGLGAGEGGSPSRRFTRAASVSAAEPHLLAIAPLDADGEVCVSARAREREGERERARGRGRGRWEGGREGGRGLFMPFRAGPMVSQSSAPYPSCPAPPPSCSCSSFFSSSFSSFKTEVKSESQKKTLVQ